MKCRREQLVGVSADTVWTKRAVVVERQQGCYASAKVGRVPVELILPHPIQPRI